jgi:hypothetical protein
VENLPLASHDGSLESRLEDALKPLACLIGWEKKVRSLKMAKIAILPKNLSLPLEP